MVQNPSVQGIGSVTADLLNSYVRAVPNVAQLRGFIGLSSMVVFLEGFTIQGDGGQGLFGWNPNAVGPDDGVMVIVPSGVSVGAWVRLSSVAAGLQPFTPSAVQMTLQNDVNWVNNGLSTSAQYWVVWDSLGTNSDGISGFNPDGMGSLTTVAPNAGTDWIHPPRSPWPGITFTATGYYNISASVTLTVSSAASLSLHTSIVIVAYAPDGSNRRLLDTEWEGTLNNTTVFDSFTLVVSGMMQVNAGDVAFVYVVDDTANNGAHLAVAAFSWFNANRVR